MLRHGCDDGDVNLGVSGVPERVETSSPGRDDSRHGQKHQAADADDEDEENERAEQRLELLSWELCAHPVDECDELEQAEHTQCRHVLATADGQEANEGDLHTCERTECIPRSVADVEPRAVPAHADQDESVQRQQVGDEDVSTPGRDHVSVEQRSHCAPEHGAELDRLDPQVEGEDEQEDGNGLVVVAAGHGARDVAGCDAHESGGEEAGRGRRNHLRRQEIGRECGEAREGGREEDANVANVDGHGEGAQEVVDGAARHHQARVESAASDSSERVPCSCSSASACGILPPSSRAEGGGSITVIEPVPELVEAVLDEVLCRAEIEPGIDYTVPSANCPVQPRARRLLTLVDDALKANHREQTAAHRGAGNEAEDDDSEQAPRVGAARLLQELAFLCSSHVAKRGVWN
jgi:hypothetical protein